MRKGEKLRPWTVSDERYLRESAGKVPRREICRHLRRSYDATRAHASRMGLSLRYYEPRTSRCPRCGSMRHRFELSGELKGVCKVCSRRELIRRCEEETARALDAMPPAMRAELLKNEQLVQSSVPPKPSPPSYEGLSPYMEAKARDEHAIALAEWEEAALNRKLKAKRRRVERMRKAIGKI